MLNTELAFAVRGTLTVCVILIIAFPLISGWGLWVRRILATGVPAESVSAGFLPFWLGVCALLVVLQIWNLFLPVQWPALLGAAVVGLSGLIVFRREVRAGLRAVDPRRALVWAIIFIPLLVWVSNRAITDSVFSDAGLYHFPKIRWINEYPVVPGLANLSWLLGYNQSFFLFLGLFNATPFFNQGHHVANALLTAVLLAQCMWAAAGVLRRPTSVSPVHLALALFIPLVAGQCMDYICSSPSPDLSITIFGMVMFALFAELALADRSNSAISRQLAGALVFMALCAVTLKLNVAPFSAALIALAFLIVWARRTTMLDVARLAGIAAITFAVAIVPWMITNFITTGYLLFPSPSTGLGADWALAADRVSTIERDVRAWARVLSLDDIDTPLATWDWLPLWSSRMQRQFVLQPLALIPLGLLGWALLRVFDRGRTRLNLMLLAPFLPPLAWAIAWFLVAPHQRYIGSGLWVMEVWALVLPLDQARQWAALSLGGVQNVIPWLERGIAIGAILIAVALLADRAPLVTSGVKPDGFVDIASARMTQFKTDSGLVLNVPEFTNQDKVWDASVPATNTREERLELRGATLREGFRIRQ